MFIRSLRGAGVAVFLASLMWAQAGPDGHWVGTLTADGREVGLSLDLAKNEKAEWIASMGVPSENAMGLYVKDLAVNGKSVKFMAVELMMSTVDLTLGPDGKLAGTITGQRGGPMPIEFKRTGEAKVALPAASPAVSKELEGDWEGSLQGPDGKLYPMVFHFKNLPDKTVAATMDSPARNVVAMPLNDVKQTGQKVEMKIAGGSFQGSLNKEGTELALQMIQGAVSLPVTLRKK
jgi:hypothetical protein